MKISNKSFVLIIILLLASGFISWHQYFKTYLQKDTVSIHAFPMQVGEWVGEEIPISDEDLAVLETRNAFVRRYAKKDGSEVFMYIVYSQTNRKVSHPPEICYTGSGIDVLENTIDTITEKASQRKIPFNRLKLERKGSRQIAFYTFKIGNSFTSSYWKQQGLIALKTLAGQVASSALIRVASDVTQDDDTAIQSIKEFCQLILPELRRVLQ